MKNTKEEFSQIELEEFKYIADRKKEYENRASQMLFFCISSFGAIYGFSDKIQKETIPYLLVFILLTSVRYFFGLQSLQNFTSAYVALKFYKNDGIYYETLFNVWSKRNAKQNFYIKLRSSVFGLLSPFSLLFIVSIFSIFYFGGNMFNEKYSGINKFMYFLGLTFLHLLILILKFRTSKYDYFYFEQFMKSHTEPNEE